MATYEGTTDYFLRDIGARIRDFSLKSGTDGRNSRARVMEMFNLAQRKVFRRLRQHVDTQVLTREATLTQDSSDTSYFYLPARTIGIQTIKDGDTIFYDITPNQLYVGEPGVYLRPRSGALGKQLWFKDLTPTTDIKVEVLEEPVIISAAANYGSSSTSLTLNTTLTEGRNINDANYYANAELRMTSGTEAGTIKNISASTTGLVCTVSAWATATPESGTDTYSIMTSLPREAWEAAAAEAAFLMQAVDKEIVEFADQLALEAKEAYMDAVMALVKPKDGMLKEPLQTIDWIR